MMTSVGPLRQGDEAAESSGLERAHAARKSQGETQDGGFWQVWSGDVVPIVPYHVFERHDQLVCVTCHKHLTEAGINECNIKDGVSIQTLRREGVLHICPRHCSCLHSVARG